MDAAGKLFRQGGIDQPVSLQKGFSQKPLGDSDYLVMGFSACGYVVHMGFIHYLQMHGGKRLVEFLFNNLLSVHGRMVSLNAAEINGYFVWLYPIPGCKGCRGFQCYGQAIFSCPVQNREKW